MATDAVTAGEGSTVLKAAETVVPTTTVGRRGPSPRTVLAVASLGAAVAFVDATIVNIAFPAIARSFPGTSISSLSWVLNAYNIVFAAFLVAAGRVADLLGRRRIFILGLEVFTAASLLCAVAPSSNVLVAFRILQALGAALLVPASLALVLNAFPPERRSHGVALPSAVAAAAAGLGPSLGGLLVGADNWRLVFLVNLPIGATAIILARRRLVESRAPGRRRMPDLLGALLFAASTAALVLGVVKGQEWGWTGGRTLGSFVLTIALGAVFIRRCRWHRSPILDLSLLRIRNFSAANAMTVVAAAGYYGYTLTNVLFLTGVWRYSVLDAGLALTPGPFVAAAVAGPTSRIVERVGHRPVLVTGGLIWGGAVLWFVEVVGLRPDFLGQWLPGIVMLGIGAGTLLPNISSAAVAATPGDSFATATGLNSVARQFGAALGVALVVAIIGTPTPLTVAATFDHAWTFGAVCLLVAGLGCLLVGRIDVQRSPSLGSATQALREPDAGPAAPRRPRVRRAFTVGDRVGTAAPRAETVPEFLGLVPLFAGLTAAQRDALGERTRAVHLEAGRWLFREGEQGDAVYIVRAGRLKVVDESAGTLLRELGRGDAVGELALLTESSRSASVRAARATDLLVVDKADFERLLEQAPKIAVALTRTLAVQLRETRAPASRERPVPATVAVVALDDPAATAELVRRLAPALAELGSCTVLDGSERAPDGAATATYGPVLDRAEATSDVVLMLSGPLSAPSAWNDFCLQQSDRILATSTGKGSIGPTAEMPELHGCDLVACDVPTGSEVLHRAAQQLIPVESHVFRAAEVIQDARRIARRLTGRSVGIVLSGGGARAFSHLGVLEELLDAGIVLDRVAGVSMGAFVGALFAMGLGIEDIDARCFEEWVQRRPLGDYTLSRTSLLRGDRMRAMLHRSFGSLAIEELPLSFLCGAAELRSGELVLTRSGPVWEGVGLSLNLPILGAPEVRGSRLLVDGSLVDNLPVAAMAEMGEGPVIAVDVKMTLEGGRQRAEGDPAVASSPTTRAPGLGETLTRVLLLASSNTRVSVSPRPGARVVGLEATAGSPSARWRPPSSVILTSTAITGPSPISAIAATGRLSTSEPSTSRRDPRTSGAPRIGRFNDSPTPSHTGPLRVRTSSPLRSSAAPQRKERGSSSMARDPKLRWSIARIRSPRSSEVRDSV